MAKVRVIAAEGERLRVTVLKAKEVDEMKPAMVMEGAAVFMREQPTGNKMTVFEPDHVVEFASETREFDVDEFTKLEVTEIVPKAPSTQGRKVD
jgi:hypothetical protein